MASIKTGTLLKLTGEDAAKMQKLLDMIEEIDDVQDVFHNAEINE